MMHKFFSVNLYTINTILFYISIYVINSYNLSIYVGLTSEILLLLGAVHCIPVQSETR